jgi:hypothetical protein
MTQTKQYEDETAVTGGKQDGRMFSLDDSERGFDAGGFYREVDAQVTKEEKHAD